MILSNIFSFLSKKYYILQSELKNLVLFYLYFIKIKNIKKEKVKGFKDVLFEKAFKRFKEEKEKYLLD